MSTVTQSVDRLHAADEPADRLSRILGDQARITLAGGLTIVEPDNDDACARALAVCSTNGWRTTVSGNGRWLPDRPPSTVHISTRRMRAMLDVRPADLYASAQAGVSTDDLANELGRHDMWLPIDPPGSRRTLGSLLGCGTQGGLRTGFGGVRDHVLGLTVVTGSGRILRLGGRVVKNVAGFDLAKLVIGGFGAYGLVTAAYIKLRAMPSRDSTVQIRGERAPLLDAAARILGSGITPGALQLTSDGSEHTLTARIVGSNDLVAADVSGVSDACGETFEELSRSAADAWWDKGRSAAVAAPVTVRIGTTPTDVMRALVITDDHPGTSTVTWSFGSATLRWSGEVDTGDLRQMREIARQAEMPLIVERAPAAVLGAVGHYGALPEGSARLARSLQAVFDPAGILSGAIWGV